MPLFRSRSRKDPEKIADKDGEPSSSSSPPRPSISAEAPPPYSETWTISPSPAIDVTAAFSNLQLSEDLRDPDPDTCLAHLKLLAAIQSLKEDIGYTDGLWNIWDARADNTTVKIDHGELSEASMASGQSSQDNRKALLSSIREKVSLPYGLHQEPDQGSSITKRWALYVARAVSRYAVWWTAMFKPCLTVRMMATPGSESYGSFPEPKKPLKWKPMMLPPLGS